MTVLIPKIRETLIGAILKAYPDEQSLEQLLMFAMDIDYRAITLGRDYRARIRYLLESFDTGGRIEELIKAIAAARPENIYIQQIRKGFSELFAKEPNIATQIQINQRRKKVRIFVENINSISLEMVFIPSGQFTMGAPETEAESRDNERPQHRVHINPFYMGRYPITQAQWQAIASLPQEGKKLDLDPSKLRGDQYPVEGVSWQDGLEFCARLSRHTGKNYRLPREAEWEYACRGGTETPFYFGETISTQRANYDGDSIYGKGVTGESRRERTEVNYFKIANEFGLSDMHGNVWEWCLDPWQENYQKLPKDEIDKNYYQDISTNINVLITDRRTHTIRGGSWGYAPRYCRSASRYSSLGDVELVGLRVVCDLEKN